VQTYLQPLRIYLDTCCLSRFFDDQTQIRIRQEAEVISWIISQFRVGDWSWISSDALVDEVEQIPDLNQRLQISDWLTDVHQTVSLGVSEISRGKQLEVLGFKELDALHLACAESGSVDIFLTTDDILLRGAKRDASYLRVRVENPYTWLQEVTKSGRPRDDR
jgi:hypothetical protein